MSLESPNDRILQKTQSIVFYTAIFVVFSILVFDNFYYQWGELAPFRVILNYVHAAILLLAGLGRLFIIPKSRLWSWIIIITTGLNVLFTVELSGIGAAIDAVFILGLVVLAGFLAGAWFTTGFSVISSLYLWFYSYPQNLDPDMAENIPLIGLFQVGITVLVVIYSHNLEITLINLKYAQKRLIEQEIDNFSTNFALGLSHNINTPLGIALLAQEQLQNENHESIDQNELHSMLEDSLGKIRKIVQQIKDYSAIDMEDSEQKVEVQEVMKVVLEAMAFNHSDLDVKVQMRPQSVEVSTKPLLLMNALAVLTENSILHGKEEGGAISISIEIKQQGKDAFLYFSDTGRGLPEGVLENFHNPKKGFTAKEGFGGLGLSTAKNILKKSADQWILFRKKRGSVGV
jgi:signal transduction histidine kinase